MSAEPTNAFCTLHTKTKTCVRSAARAIAARVRNLVTWRRVKMEEVLNENNAYGDDAVPVHFFFFTTT